MNSLKKALDQDFEGLRDLHPWCFGIQTVFLIVRIPFRTMHSKLQTHQVLSCRGRTCRLPTDLHGGQITGLQFKRFCTLSWRHPGTGTHRRGVSRGCHWESWYSFWGQDTVGEFLNFPKMERHKNWPTYPAHDSRTQLASIKPKLHSESFAKIIKRCLQT